MSAHAAFWAHFDNRAETWRDGGPERELLDRMSPDEKNRSEVELLRRLVEKPRNDAWVVPALARLKESSGD